VFLRELETLYEPFNKGGVFLELAVDYPDHDDVPGFIDYVRQMDSVDFVFYCVGRIMTREEIAATGLELESFHTALNDCAFDYGCWYTEMPFEKIITDVPTFQNRLADLWQTYWDDFFHTQIDDLRAHWEHALSDKMAVLNSQGGQALYEHVTGRSSTQPALPPDYPVQEIVFIPVYLIPSPVYVFYGYGNETVLFDSERTEARRAEIERNKDQSIAILKALGDNSRLDILRLIVHHGEKMHGKTIAQKLNLSASAVSRHLAQLKDAGLIVEETRDNRTITYRFQREAIGRLPDMLWDYLYH
jgi:DNA-binding transcriptional ArsR family regulator